MKDRDEPRADSDWPMEESVIHLSPEDQQLFAALLLDPPEPTDALRRAKEAHARLVRARAGADLPLDHANKPAE